MADISKIKALDGTTYDIKDNVAMNLPYIRPLMTKTYTDIIATSNDNRGAGFFCIKVRGDTWTSTWRVKFRIRASVPSGTNAQYYYTDSSTVPQ